MRKGIIAGGNWIVDYVKILDKLPGKGMLGSILDEVKNIGGGPPNILIDIACMDPSIPLEAVGIVGNDEKGLFIKETAQKHNINTRWLYTTDEKATSYTDVMTEKDTGHRTFFHYRGANALLGVEHFLPIESNAFIFYIGYLLLLDKLDAYDDEFDVVAARVLSIIQSKGFKTAVDVVSEDSDRFQNIVKPCLKYIDYLLINEIEAERISGHKIRTSHDVINKDNLLTTAKMLLASGVKDLVVIHFPEGGFAMTKNSEWFFAPSFLVEPHEIKGTVGAGDAFCAGILYALHQQNNDIPFALKLANANAAINLFNPTTTGGAVSYEKVLNFMQTRKTNTFEL